MVAVEDRVAGGLEQRREPFLALDIGQAGEVLAAVDEQVEGVEGEVGLAALEARLQQLEVGLAVLAERHRLAVDQAAGGQVRRPP